MNLYNDNDAKVCAWTEELIRAGVIAPGDVLCKSIEDITPDELRSYTQCHFFNGIAGWPHALDLAGWPRTRPVWTASLPCQSFSCAGKGQGFGDARGNLWFPFLRLVRECRPECIFGEQVEAAVGHGWLDRIFTDLEAEGYAGGACVLGAHSVGAPHRRQRIYWMANTISTDELKWTQAKQQTESLRGSEMRGLAHAELRRPEQCDQGQRPVSKPDSGCDDERMAHTPSGGLGTDGSASGHTGHAEQRKQNGGVGQPSQPGLEGHAWNGNDRNQPGRIEADPAGPTAAPSTINFWSSAIWHPCRDGKARRVAPSQAGIEPVLQRVVDGFPGSLDNRRAILNAYAGFPLSEGIRGRVMLLRGYGNAIVPHVAAEFVKVAIAAINERTQ